MAHNLATINGKTAMAYQGETPWHKLGTRIGGGLSIAEALDAASLNWNVELQPMFLGNGSKVPNRVAVVRPLDNAILGTASDWFQPIQNAEAFDLFSGAMGEFGLTVESAGALGQGEKVWMLFKLPTTLAPVAGDNINGYGVAITGHDGKTSCEFRPTPIRVVCQNTLNMAVGAGGNKGRIYGISHIGNVRKDIDAAAKLVNSVMAAMQETGETFAAMARRRMTPQDVIAFVESVFPTPKDGKVTDQLAQKRSDVAALVFEGVGSDMAMQETAGQPNPWACYNAVTEYFDHVLTGKAKTSRAVTASNASALFGTGADVKLLALERARELVMA